MRTKINLRKLVEILAFLPQTAKQADFNLFDPEIYGLTISQRHFDFKNQFKTWEYPDPETLPERYNPQCDGN